MDWSVRCTVVVNMWQIVGSVVKNQAFGGKCLISEAIVDTGKVNIYFSGDEEYDLLRVGLY